MADSGEREGRLTRWRLARPEEYGTMLAPPDERYPEIVQAIVEEEAAERAS